MILKIVHLADIHIHNEIKRHPEYRIQFQKLYNKLKKDKPDRIVIVGDIFEDFIEISNEAKILAGEFLNNLSKICKVIITRGNHDLRKRNLDRLDSILTIVELIDNKNITYYNQTGFYSDDNIMWCVHNHGEKNSQGFRSNPWNDCVVPTDIKEYVTIDLYHDPVNGCLMDNGYVNNKTSLPSIGDMKGDYSFLGDIHLMQFFSKTKAYCGSLIQQDFGEPLENHGYILWDLNTKSGKHIHIDSDYTFINTQVLQSSDYDNLTFQIPAKPYSQVMVHWTDYASQINVENEDKIKQYIKDTFNIVEVKFDKNTLYQDISSSKLLSEKIDINDTENQRNIFIEFLEAKKYKKEQIQNILDIDEIVNSRLEIKSNQNIQWSIDNIWFNNFKSYGDNNKINWSDKNGLIQINGENREGKSTLIDVISYILYGTTFYTHTIGGAKRETNADARYINNKRDLDYCEGGLTLIVDGIYYKIIRKTERSWDKGRKNAKSSTILTFLDADGNPLNEEQTKGTQAYLDTILGTFEDFIRQTLTNSDNINSMFSISRATFLDSLIRDAGYDIFEKKLAEFKKYVKELNEDKIVINIDSEKLQIEDYEKENKQLSDNISDNISIIKGWKKEQSELKESIESLLESLHNVESDIEQLDIEKSKELVKSYQETIQKDLEEIELNNHNKKNLPTTFDEERLDKLRHNLNILSEKISDIKLKISNNDKGIEKEKGTIERVDMTIDKYKEKTNTEILNNIKEVESEIKLISNSYYDIVKEIDNKFKLELKDLDNKIDNTNSNIKNIKSQGIENKKNIESYKNSISTNICCTCNRPLDEHESIEEKIKMENEKLQTLFEEARSEQEKLHPLQENKQELELKLENLSNGKYDEFPEIIEKQNQDNEKMKSLGDKIKQYKSIINNINHEDYSDIESLQEKILTGLKLKQESLEKIKAYKEEKVTFDEEISKIESNKNSIESQVLSLEKVKNEYKMYKTLTERNQELQLEIEKYRNNLEKIQQKLVRYQEQIKFIEENKVKKESISELKEQLLKLEKDEQTTLDSIKTDEQSVVLNNDRIKNIRKKIESYLEQEHKNQLYKEYQECLERDGIPSYLLKKSLDIINNKIRDLLSEVDFDVYFNENLQLKMIDKGKEINILEGSGSERTITSTILKISIRSINTISKPDFIFYDEIFGKLKSQYVQIMKNILSHIKKEISKVIIIEHKEAIDYDYLIEVTKDQDGVSTLEMN